MNFVVKLFPEITIKSGPVRKRMNRQLTENMRILLRRVDASAKVVSDWDKIEVRVDGDEEHTARAMADALGRIPGIANYARVRVLTFNSMHDIYEAAFQTWSSGLAGKTFCVRVKRNGKHEFTSTDVERYVGGGLNQHTDAAGVKLKGADVEVRLEVRDDRVFIVEQAYPGLGGYPIGSHEPVLSLVSGGFDSTVASYQSIKRGLRTHYLFFNLGGKEHELGVKEIAFYLWNRFGASHRVKFISVPFDGVVNDILQNVDPSCMGVILKRLMLRAASSIAERLDVAALVTGEAVAQVSSQTLTNLAIIDQAATKLVLRPLAMMDKGDIINQCRAIGAEDFAANIPEYCGVISVRPSARLKSYKVIEEEAKLSPEALQAALDGVKVQLIDSVMADVELGVQAAEVLNEVPPGYVVVDIRHPNDIDIKPLGLESSQVVAIPFYSLTSRFVELDKNKTYLLYCDKGVMSQLHAAHLLDEGFTNIGVYRP